MNRLLIADDHKLFRDGVVSLLETHPGLEIACQAANGKEALRFLETATVDLALLDVSMPEMDGITLATAIRERFPQTKVLMLTMHNNPETIQSVIKAGAQGYLLKDSSKQELILGIETVLEGNTYFANQVKDTLIAGFRSEKVITEIRLTTREKDILQLICQEMTTQEIADALFISSHTVESHRKNLIAKTGVKSSVGLVKFAIENGLDS